MGGQRLNVILALPSVISILLPSYLPPFPSFLRPAFVIPAQAGIRAAGKPQFAPRRPDGPPNPRRSAAERRRQPESSPHAWFLPTQE